MLPNTMAWTFTAVPHHSGMSCSCLALHHHSCLTVLRGSYQSKCGGQPDGSSVPALSLIWELQMHRLQHPRHLRTIQSRQGHTTILEANPVATRIRLSMRCLYVLARWFIQELKTLRARMLRGRSEDTRLINVLFYFQAQKQHQLHPTAGLSDLRGSPRPAPTAPQLCTLFLELWAFTYHRRAYCLALAPFPAKAHMPTHPATPPNIQYPQHTPVTPYTRYQKYLTATPSIPCNVPFRCDLTNFSKSSASNSQSSTESLHCKL